MAAYAFSLSENSVPLIKELWDYFYNTYFTEGTLVFDNLNFGTGSMISLRNILFGILVGFVIASIVITYDKRYLGDFVRKLLSAGAVGRENAKSIAELGYGKHFFVTNSLKRGTNLRRVVKCVEEIDYNEDMEKQKREYEDKRRENPSLPSFKELSYSMNVGNAHFFIPEKDEYAAGAKFNKKGTTWLGVVIIIICAIIGYVLLLAVLPQLLTMLDNLIGSVKN